MYAVVIALPEPSSKRVIESLEVPPAVVLDVDQEPLANGPEKTFNLSRDGRHRVCLNTCSNSWVFVITERWYKRDPKSPLEHSL